MHKAGFGKWFLICSLLLASILSGCGNNNAASGNAGSNGNAAADAGEKAVTLKMTIWDSSDDLLTYLTNKVKEFNTVMPNVTVELETFKNDGDYLQSMKVRSGGNSLPDVITLKPNWLSDFEEQLLPLDGLSVLERSKYADKYKINGKVLAIPTMSFPELVYYHPSIFTELGLEVPTTWPQFIDVLKAIQASGKYIPYAMGGKDAWPTYPFNEFLPHIISDNADYLSDMAKEDAPFAEGTPFYEGYSQIADLYNAKVMGPDPLGVGADQANDLFISKQAAVMASGLWFLPTYEAKAGNTDDLAAFPMPYRMSEDTPLKLMTFTDHFYGISNSSKHQEEAKAFLEWFYSPEVYQEYLNKAQLLSTFEGVEADIPFLNDFYAANKVEPFLYVPGDSVYTELSNAIQLDVKAIGQEMLSGRTVADISKKLDEKWTAARKSLK